MHAHTHGRVHEEHRTYSVSTIMNIAMRNISTRIIMSIRTKNLSHQSSASMVMMRVSHNHTHEHHEEHHTHSQMSMKNTNIHMNTDHEGHTHAHGHSHHHTSMKDIEHIIGHLNVPEKVKEDAIAVYKLIADAESHAHGRPVEEVHFHEVGAMDAVADIVGVCLAIYKLAPEQSYRFSCPCRFRTNSLCTWYSSNPSSGNCTHFTGNSYLWRKN